MPIRIRSRKFSLFILLPLVVAIIFAIGNHPVSTGPADGQAFTGTPTTLPTSPYVRIGTFNIDGGQGIDGNVDLKRTASCMQKLDFIGMNEVHGFVWKQPQNQAIELGAILHLPYLYVPAERQWGHDTFGNAVFSNLPIQQWQRIELPNQSFKAKRNYLLTKVDWHHTTLNIITTHTDWKAGGEVQFEIVRDRFLSLPPPAILMGDLNTPASNPLIQGLKQTRGVEEAVGKVLEPIPGRVDWIFLRGLTTVDAGKVDLKASDHPAYWASVKLSDATVPAAAKARNDKPTAPVHRLPI